MLGFARTGVGDTGMAFAKARLTLTVPEGGAVLRAHRQGDTTDEITPQHYAFLVAEDDFGTIFARIQQAGLTYWADPSHHRPGEINHNDGGRGAYFDDPDGHRLEILTRPYGSGG
ncbi:VOC family protein [Streptomyces sviceus]|uniref:VOC family protein n=1 Tax=Streptomyces sviceus TaxID=285530 RepID=UPI003803074E